MPIVARVVLLHYPHHVVQRGHNKQTVFTAPVDLERYPIDLHELKSLPDVKVYAFCLMSNHVHLLLAPGESTTSLGQLMKSLAKRKTPNRAPHAYNHSPDDL